MNPKFNTKAVIVAGVVILSVVGLTACKSNDVLPMDEVMEETALLSETNEPISDGSKFKEMAKDAFETLLNVPDELSPSTEISAEFITRDERQYYFVQWASAESEDSETKAAQYTAIIDVEKNKIVQLNYNPGEPENADYSEYSEEEAQAAAVDFIKNSNLLGEDYEIKEEPSVNSEKNAYDFIFYFDYNGGMTCLVTVNKENQAVNQFMLLDEFTNLG